MGSAGVDDRGVDRYRSLFWVRRGKECLMDTLFIQLFIGK